MPDPYRPPPPTPPAGLDPHQGELFKLSYTIKADLQEVENAKALAKLSEIADWFIPFRKKIPSGILVFDYLVHSSIDRARADLKSDIDRVEFVLLDSGLATEQDLLHLPFINAEKRKSALANLLSRIKLVRLLGSLEAGEVVLKTELELKLNFLLNEAQTAGTNDTLEGVEAHAQELLKLVKTKLVASVETGNDGTGKAKAGGKPPFAQIVPTWFSDP